MGDESMGTTTIQFGDKSHKWSKQELAWKAARDEEHQRLKQLISDLLDGKEPDSDLPAEKVEQARAIVEAGKADEVIDAPEQWGKVLREIELAESEAVEPSAMFEPEEKQWHSPSRGKPGKLRLGRILEDVGTSGHTSATRKATRAIKGG